MTVSRVDDRLQMQGGLSVNFESLRYLTLMARAILRGEQMMIGSVVKQFGPFRLHRWAISLKGEGLLDLSSYYVVVGELPVPLMLPLRTGRSDPRSYQRVVRNREGPFRGCVQVGDISIKKSTHRDLYDHVDRWLTNKQIAIACYAEQFAAVKSAATSTSRRVEFWRESVARVEAEYQAVSAAFQEFLLEYPDAAGATRRDAAVKEREARRDRKRYLRGIRLINRAVR